MEEVLSAFAQYGEWLPAARHVKALKDKGALLVAKGDHVGAVNAVPYIHQLLELP